MDDAALVAESHVGTDEDVIGDRLPENLDAEDIGDYFFGFALEVGMHEGDVVVGYDYVSEGRETFFYSLLHVSVMILSPPHSSLLSQL
jgi:hypothetical protein